MRSTPSARDAAGAGAARGSDAGTDGAMRGNAGAASNSRTTFSSVARSLGSLLLSSLP